MNLLNFFAIHFTTRANKIALRFENRPLHVRQTEGALESRLLLVYLFTCLLVSLSLCLQLDALCGMIKPNSMMIHTAQPIVPTRLC
jgi:hypothetical protein